MRAASQEARILPAVRVVSTPVPQRRLYGDLAEQCRAVFDDVLAEPVPDRLLALAVLSDRTQTCETGRAAGADRDLRAQAEAANPSHRWR